MKQNYFLVSLLIIMVISCVPNKQGTSSSQEKIIDKKGVLFIEFVDTSNHGDPYTVLGEFIKVGPTTQVLAKRVFYSSQESVSLIAKVPDGQTAQILVPSGKGFKSANILTLNTHEPLKINANKLLNILCSTTDTEYVDLTLMISPIITDDSGSAYWSLNESDIQLLNELLKSKG